MVDIREYLPRIIVPDEALRGMQHTFLIRDPSKAVPSYYRACQRLLDEFGPWSPDETGLLESVVLYDHLVKLNPERRPLVLDAQDLITRPEAVLQAWCEYVGVAYDESMLTWEARPVKEFESWKGWHDDVENTSGFKHNHPASNQPPQSTQAEEPLPPAVWREVNRNMPYYEYLYERRAQLS